MPVAFPERARGATLVISAFVERFNEVLKDPQNCRLGLSAPNLVLALHREVNKWIDRLNSTTASHKKSDLHRALDVKFLEMSRRRDAGMHLLRKLHQSELDVIELDAIGQATTTASADLLVLSLALEAVVATIDSPAPAISDFLARELPTLSQSFALGDSTASSLTSAADLIARAALLHEDADNLKKQLKYWLSEGTVDVIVRSSEGALANDPELTDAIRLAGKEILARVISTVPSRDLADRPEAEIGYAQLWQASRAIMGRRLGDEGAARNLISGLVQTAASRTSFSLFVYFIGEHSPELKGVWSAEDKAAAIVGKLLTDSGWIRRSGDFHPWGSFIHEAIRHWLATAVARGASNRLQLSNAKVAAELEAWIESIAANSVSQSSQETFWYLADRSQQTTIKNFWDAIRPQVLDAVVAELSALAEPTSTYLEDNLRIDDFISSMRARSASSESAWEWTNWDRIALTELPVALRKLREAFSEFKEFDVIVPIEGATIYPHSWTTEDLSWYSSATHSLGEASLSDVEPEKGANIHVWTRASATSGTSAVEQVLLKLEPILSATSFALSSGHGFGYRPEIGSWYMYGEINTGDGAFRGHRDRAESADSRVDPKDVERFGKNYELAFRRASLANTHSELAVRFKRALFWYRSGRWQKDHTRRLLDHYLAVEHFFAAGHGKDQQVAHAIGEIEGSWRYRRFPFSERVHDAMNAADTLRKFAQRDHEVEAACELVVRNQLSTCRSAQHWQVSRGPWLSPSFVRAVTSELQSSSLDSSWSMHLSALASLAQGEPAWRNEDTQRKEAAWFKIRVIAQRRHEIVHDALTHVAGIQYEADALTETAERVLRHIASYFLVHPVGSTVKDVLDDLVPPWLT